MIAQVKLLKAANPVDPDGSLSNDLRLEDVNVLGHRLAVGIDGQLPNGDRVVIPWTSIHYVVYPDPDTEPF